MDFMSYLERAKGLDRLITPLQRAARLLPPGLARDALHGVWLGHPLHPLLVQAPIGTWLSASLLDIEYSNFARRLRSYFGQGKIGALDWPGNEKAARRLVLAGLVAAVPAAIAGAADWSEQHEQQMRVGLVHAGANATAMALYTASLAVPARGRTLRLAGLTAAGLGGFLGGHIAYRQSAGANQTEPVPHLVEPGWHDLMPEAEVAALDDGKPARRMLGEVPVVVVRDGDAVHVLAGRCAHLSGPLPDGECEDGELTCPWHGSTFRLADGAVTRGPATAPQPVFATRVAGTMIQACLPGAG